MPAEDEIRATCTLVIDPMIDPVSAVDDFTEVAQVFSSVLLVWAPLYPCELNGTDEFVVVVFTVDCNDCDSVDCDGDSDGGGGGGSDACDSNGDGDACDSDGADVVFDDDNDDGSGDFDNDIGIGCDDVFCDTNEDRYRLELLMGEELVSDIVEFAAANIVVVVVDDDALEN